MADNEQARVTGRGAELTSNPDTDPGNAEPMREVRLRMKPKTAAHGYVDGAWWPRSHNPAAEFPGLARAMSSWVGPVRRVAYNLDANTVVVTGSNRRRMSLLVVPAGTPGGVARAVLRSATGSDTVASVEEILTSNGVRLGRRVACGTVLWTDWLSMAAHDHTAERHRHRT